MQDDYLLNILKIPIFKPENFTYYKVHPIRNPDEFVLIPDARYVLDHNQWIQQECQEANDVCICFDALASRCTFYNTSTCEFEK